MVVIQDKFMFMDIKVVSLNKLVKLTLLKILNLLIALLFKNVKTVLLQLVQNQVIKVIAGLNQNIQFGKSINMEQSTELTK